MMRALACEKTKEYFPVAKPIRTLCTAAALIPLTVLAAACSSSGSSSSSSSSSPAAAASSSASGTAITETGSTLMFPLFGAWQTAYNTAVPSVMITTAGTGSGTGIADAGTGTATIGASDAYLSSSNMSQYPGLMNIPLTVAALMVNYNVSGVKKPLNLNGTVLAQIYSGKITTWNDPGGWSATNVGTTVGWPSKASALAETGSGGMVTGCGATKGCIAYIGISYLSKTSTAGLGEASLANKAGKFTEPTPAAINAALASFSGSTPSSGSQSLINTSAPTGYPVINYEYAVVKKTQPNASTASNLKAFLTWTLTTGASSKYLSAVSFQPLPANVTTVAKNLVSSISG